MMISQGPSTALRAVPSNVEGRLTAGGRDAPIRDAPIRAGAGRKEPAARHVQAAAEDRRILAPAMCTVRLAEHCADTIQRAELFLRGRPSQASHGSRLRQDCLHLKMAVHAGVVAAVAQNICDKVALIILPSLIQLGDELSTLFGPPPINWPIISASQRKERFLRFCPSHAAQLFSEPSAKYRARVRVLHLV